MRRTKLIVFSSLCLIVGTFGIMHFLGRSHNMQQINSTQSVSSNKIEKNTVVTITNITPITYAKYIDTNSCDDKIHTRDKCKPNIKKVMVLAGHNIEYSASGQRESGVVIGPFSAGLSVGQKIKLSAIPFIRTEF